LALASQRDTILLLAKVASLEIGAGLDKPKGSAVTARSGVEVIVPLEGLIDLNRERDRLRKEIEQLGLWLERTEAKLSNPAFVERAPAALVEEERRKAEGYRFKRSQLEKRLEELA
jgi:valyl-tRNA synthetase